MKEFWDRRYSSRVYAYGTKPNKRFRNFIDGLPPGSVLLPGEGEGRNAVYAASRGWQVHAVDQSTEGRCKALALADERGIVLDYDVADLLEYPFRSESYDVVSLIFVHFIPDIRRSIHERLVHALKPGGYFHLLGFSPDQLKYGTGGPGDPAMLYTPEILQEDFGALTDISITNINEKFREGEFHKGRYRAVEMIGRKPA